MQASFRSSNGECKKAATGWTSPIQGLHRVNRTPHLTRGVHRTSLSLIAHRISYRVFQTIMLYLLHFLCSMD
ncbi:hypothetical protein BDW42DRAFT_170259 [Aspergillus taichungensis]|uniref:Uncharacterized protein n=1 Tax=Aspergillus taichungensis TaxID=482145 RepID=A0A2J5HU80_9EURO|nr:hypothetical protein BDW42DRAFT_170259 [Aspergillus taichungensis]